MPDNDNEPAAPSPIPAPSDAHGHAALLLIESLIHGLCEKNALSAGEAADIAERAIAIQLERVAEADGDEARHLRCHALLTVIAKSLRIDDGATIPPRPDS